MGSIVPFAPKEYKNFLVINTLYGQQKKMYDQRTHSVDDRIVSIHQPHVRPIVRGGTPLPYLSVLDEFTYDTSYKKLQRSYRDAAQDRLSFLRNKFYADSFLILCKDAEPIGDCLQRTVLLRKVEVVQYTHPVDFHAKHT